LRRSGSSLLYKAYEADYIRMFGEEWSLDLDYDDDDDEEWAADFTSRHMIEFENEYDFGLANDKAWLNSFIDEFGKEFTDRFNREWEG